MSEQVPSNEWIHNIKLDSIQSSKQTKHIDALKLEDGNSNVIKPVIKKFGGAEKHVQMLRSVIVMYNSIQRFYVDTSIVQ